MCAQRAIRHVAVNDKSKQHARLLFIHTASLISLPHTLSASRQRVIVHSTALQLLNTTLKSSKSQCLPSRASLPLRLWLPSPAPRPSPSRPRATTPSTRPPLRLTPATSSNSSLSPLTTASFLATIRLPALRCPSEAVSSLALLTLRAAKLYECPCPVRRNARG